MNPAGGRGRIFAPGFAVLLALGCGDWETDPSLSPVDAGMGDGATADDAGREDAAVPADHPTGLHVVANRILDSEDRIRVLRGVNRSGSEYRCVDNRGFFDGPADQASIDVMKSWNVNAVRVPLNESCWLGKPGVAERYAGENYKAAILEYVALLHRNGMVPILDLHWAAPGDELARGLWQMPNADNSPAFWRDVANTFLEDEGVVFEPYNEPFPDSNNDTVAAWSCWRDGCETRRPGGAGTYAAAGMQVLVDAIRGTGARHLILLGGVQFSNALTLWREYQPRDPLGNTAAAWHIYNFNRCNNPGCWNGIPAELAAELPIVATEIGQGDCAGESFLRPLMQFLDEQETGYLAWSWNALNECTPRTDDDDGQPWFLITDFESGEPTSDYGRIFREHMLETAP